MDAPSAGAAVPEIPRDLWFDILLKVAAGDIRIWRSVSKFHRNLIDSPYFIKKHHQLSAKTSHVILTGVVDQYLNLDTSKFFQNFEKPLKNRHGFVQGYLEDSCMGILCYHVPIQDCLILWNPLTGCSRRISLKSNKNSNSTIRFLLGYDAVTDDFQVLQMINSALADSRFWRFHDRYVDFEIYSSKMDSWKKLRLEGNFENGFMVSLATPVFLEGTNSIHWISSENHVLIYNFSTQKFNKFKFVLPEIPTESDPRVSSLGGCLCVSRSWWRGINERHLDVAMMQRYGVEQSWIPIFSVTHSIDGCYLLPLILNDEGDQLVIFSPRRGLYRYYRNGRFERIDHLLNIYSSELYKNISLESRGFEALVFTPTIWKP